MTNTIDKIAEAISPARILGRKPKRRASANDATTTQKRLQAVKKQLAKLSKDFEQLARTVSASNSSAKKATAAKAAARKPTRAAAKRGKPARRASNA